MEIVYVTQNQRYAEADLPERFCPGSYVQLVRDQYGYCVQLVTPMMKTWILKNVKRLATVNKHLAQYGVRFCIKEDA